MEQTIREVIHRWLKMGLVGLSSTIGRGVKQTWKQSDIVYLEECLLNE